MIFFSNCSPYLNRLCRSLFLPLLLPPLLLSSSYYRSSIRVEQISKRFMSHLRTLWLDQHLTAFLWEVVICIWHEPPFVAHWVDISLPETERGIGGSPQACVVGGWSVGRQAMNEQPPKNSELFHIIEHFPSQTTHS